VNNLQICLTDQSRKKNCGAADGSIKWASRHLRHTNDNLHILWIDRMHHNRWTVQ